MTSDGVWAEGNTEKLTPTVRERDVCNLQKMHATGRLTTLSARPLIEREMLENTCEEERKKERRVRCQQTCAGMGFLQNRLH